MKKIRKLEPKIWILCEWETEECYFSVIKNKKILWKNISIHKIWQISWISKNKLKNIRKKVNYSDKDLKNTNSKVFILLDIDWNKKESYSQDNIDFIKNNLENENIKVLFSNKDFEIWILLHLQDCIKENVDYIKIIREHKNWEKKYKKWNNNCNIRFFQKIIDNYLNDAVERAKILEQRYIKRKLKQKIPYTEIYKIFFN